jgi:beta-lactamase regulating signal transducer with metallopeptidase domain
MIEAVIDHLWQSTGFALVVAALTLAFRRHSAALRFRIWLAASMKFLVPFAPLIVLGRELPWRTASVVHATAVVQKIAQPWGMTLGFESASPSHAPAGWHWGVWSLALGLWLAGFLILTACRTLQWLKLRAVVQSSTPLDIKAPIPVREMKTALEPGIYGILKPVMVLPAGLANRLAPKQLDTILAHEIQHWRRQDNLTASLQMLIEALFWFHPLIWWLGGRLIIERERACDEAVVQSGSDREIYAGSILKVCQHYVEPQLPCISAVSGGTLRKRIEEIMTGHAVIKLSLAKQCLLIVAAIGTIAAPLAVGLVGAAMAQTGDSATTESKAIKHYKNADFGFQVDIPSSWRVVPHAACCNGEMVRFSSTNSSHDYTLYIARFPHDPMQSPQAEAERAQQNLIKKELYSNFLTGQTTLGSEQVVTLDFDSLNGSRDGTSHHVRDYFMISGTFLYILVFSTDRMTDVVPDQVAGSFVATGND